ncbi:hypothetical protein C8Q70DRAFT_738773 [Cubamyces menziesii]|nr:hypothetical protein C8Q70DRAFT_738773 [Cubamyces menziesii]
MTRPNGSIIRRAVRTPRFPRVRPRFKLKVCVLRPPEPPSLRLSARARVRSHARIHQALPRTHSFPSTAPTRPLRSSRLQTPSPPSHPSAPVLSLSLSLPLSLSLCLCLVRPGRSSAVPEASGLESGVWGLKLGKHRGHGRKAREPGVTTAGASPCLPFSPPALRASLPCVPAVLYRVLVAWIARDGTRSVSYSAWALALALAFAFAFARARARDQPSSLYADAGFCHCSDACYSAFREFTGPPRVGPDCLSSLCWAQ